MKKILQISILSFLFVCLLSISASAFHSNSFTFYYEDREITVESIHMSQEEAQVIADFIAHGPSAVGFIEPGNTTNTPLLCIMFGHSIETYTARETIHNVYTSSPKCVINRYNVERCTRTSCDYIQTTLIDSTRTAVCHG